MSLTVRAVCKQSVQPSKTLSSKGFVVNTLNKLPCLKSSPKKNLLPSIVESQTENYRELLPHLLLGVKIKEPLELQNLTVSLFIFFFLK